MRRTQIYLTEEENSSLDALAMSRRCSRSELIREAVDRFLKSQSVQGRRDLMRRASSMWADHKGLPDIQALRREWDRPLGETK